MRTVLRSPSSLVEVTVFVEQPALLSRVSTVLLSVAGRSTTIASGALRSIKAVRAAAAWMPERAGAPG